MEKNVYYYEDYRNTKEKENSKEKESRDDDFYNDYDEYNHNRSSFVKRDRNSSTRNDTSKDDNGYYDEDYHESFTKKNKKLKAGAKQTLIIMQLISCAVIVGAVLIIKSFFPQYYSVFCEWYNSEINKSIVAGEGTENYNVIENAPSDSSSSVVSATGVSVTLRINNTSDILYFV